MRVGESVYLGFPQDEEVRVLVKFRGLAYLPITPDHTTVALADSDFGAIDFLHPGDIFRCETQSGADEPSAVDAFIRERVCIVGIEQSTIFFDAYYIELVRGWQRTTISTHDERCTWRLVNRILLPAEPE